MVGARPSVPRLYFGQTITADSRRSHCCGKEGHILGFGKKPGGARHHLYLVKEEGPAGALEGDVIFEQLQPAVAALTNHALKLEEGPYGDKDGLVDDLVSNVCRDLDEDDMVEVIERVIDRVRPFVGPDAENAFPRIYGRSKYDFHLDIDLTTREDALPTAGNILADDERISLSEVTGAQNFVLIHPMEPLVIATSVLRQWGLPAYPARAVREGHKGNEEYSPLIAVVDLSKDIPLHTCTLIRSHPDMGSIDILSDVAVRGVIHGMRAIMRAKHLGAELVIQFLEGRPLSESEIKNQIKRIADDLIQCHTDWEGQNDFVTNALMFLHHDVMCAEAWINLRTTMDDLLLSEQQPDVFLANKGIVKIAPVVPINPEHTGLFFAMDGDFLSIYPHLAEAAAQAWMMAAENAKTVTDAVQAQLNFEIRPQE